MTKQMLGALARGVAAAAVFTFLALSAGTAARAADTTVKIGNFTFGPKELRVKAGTRVTWINEDDIPHTVTSTTLAFKSKPLDSDDKFAFTFTSPGTYTYFCSLHPHMTGSIVVEAATGSAAPP